MTPPHDRSPLPSCVKDLDPIPPAFLTTLRAGLAIALTGRYPDGDRGALSDPPAQPDLLTEAQFEAVCDHARLLMAWNQAINLSGIRDPEMIARDHVLDSLTAVPLLRGAGIDEFVDLGSGGGYPGLALAAALPARRALLVESVGKKARFLATAAEAVGLADRVEVAATRAEAVAADPRHRERWQAVLARAVAELSELAELSLPLLRPGGLLVAWKRRPVDDELGRADRALHQLGGRLIAVDGVTVPGLDDHVLAVVEKVASTPPEFPRDPAVRRRRPL